MDIIEMNILNALEAFCSSITLCDAMMALSNEHVVDESDNPHTSRKMLRSIYVEQTDNISSLFSKLSR